MLTYQNALETILRNVSVMPTTHLPIDRALGLVTARPIVAKRDMPAFDQSAMDGYAVLARDTTTASSASPVKLRLIGESFAGKPSRQTVRSGTAIKIMTGGIVPRGADSIVIKEHCQETDGFVLINEAVRKTGQHIRLRGAEFEKGDTVLESGHPINPPVIGLLATCGYGSVTVHALPRVTLIVTGDELVELGRSLRSGQIYDANSHALAAALVSLGTTQIRTVRCVDESSVLKRFLKQGLRTSDLVITAGGVSVGERDLVKDALEELGVRTEFWRVAIKPGKPNYFGTFRAPRTRRRTLVFGLPGNPVSALISFHKLVRPAILKMMGHRDLTPRRFQGSFRGDFSRKSGRLEWLRGRLSANDEGISASAYHGQESHMLGALAKANCLIEVPLETETLGEGESIAIEQLRWGMPDSPSQAT